MEYEHLAAGLRDAVVADPAILDADRLASVTEADVARWVTPPHVLPNVSAGARRRGLAGSTEGCRRRHVCPRRESHHHHHHHHPPTLPRP
jgi:hypothetical protein